MHFGVESAHLNKRAETLLSHPDSEICNKVGKLVCLNPEQNTKLKQLIINATQPTAMSGAMLTEYAMESGSSINTVRTQLRALLRKTETKKTSKINCDFV